MYHARTSHQHKCASRPTQRAWIIDHRTPPSPPAGLVIKLILRLAKLMHRYHRAAITHLPPLRLFSRRQFMLSQIKTLRLPGITRDSPPLPSSLHKLVLLKVFFFFFFMSIVKDYTVLQTNAISIVRGSFIILHRKSSCD